MKGLIGTSLRLLLLILVGVAGEGYGEVFGGHFVPAQIISAAALGAISLAVYWIPFWLIVLLIVRLSGIDLSRWARPGPYIATLVVANVAGYLVGLLQYRTLGPPPY